MIAARLLEHFDRVAEAPGAVPRLRRFVLDLAVRGMLVAQNPSDRSAADLLTEILKRREQRDAGAAPSRRQTLLPPGPHQVPFGVPENWKLVRLGTALHLVNGRAFKPTDWSRSGVPIVRIQNLNDAHASFNYCAFPVQEKFHLKDGDLLISWSGTPGTSFGAHIWNRGHAILNQHTFRAEQIGTGFTTAFLKLAINARLLELIDNAHGGVGLQHITKPKLENLPLTLPPTEEQHRIVKRLEDLMALCDRLEAAQAEREARRQSLVFASLHGLQDPRHLREPMGSPYIFLSEAFRLLQKPSDIANLRRTIRNVAVRGYLVRQSPADEPAHALLERVRQQKVRLLEAGLIRKQEVLEPPPDDRVPFGLPSAWAWTRIGTCASVVEYGTSVRSVATNDGVPVLKMGDIQDGRILAGDQTRVPAEIDDLPQLYLKKFDLLYNRTNSAELVGKTGLYTGESNRYTFASYLIRIQFLNELISPHYINLAMNAPYFRDTQIVPELQQQCGQANVNGTKLKNMMIPLPPLEEQRRIVARVDELMAVCDRLEGQIIAGNVTSSRLLDALLHEALAGPPTTHLMEAT